MSDFDVSNRQIQLAIILKLNQLQREKYSNLTYDNIIDVLMVWKWKRNLPKSLHEAVDDILSLTTDQIVQLLSRQALIEGHNKSLADIEDLVENINHYSH